MEKNKNMTLPFETPRGSRLVLWHLQHFADLIILVAHGFHAQSAMASHLGRGWAPIDGFLAGTSQRKMDDLGVYTPFLGNPHIVCLSHFGEDPHDGLKA
jgi:hypothetical protein